MAITSLLSSSSSPIPSSPQITKQSNHSSQFSLLNSHPFHVTHQIPSPKPIICRTVHTQKAIEALAGVAGLAAMSAFVGPASASDLTLVGSTLQLVEPSNALSLPTWAIHVSSVVEWITAMALVWQYGEKSGYESWKGLSWGMVPLLGGAFCACTWHFFYNAESLQVLVALQGALTVIGNFTMCIAAYRIYKSSQERSENN